MSPPRTIEPLDEAELSSCPRCGAAADSGQEYCLECGLRLPLAEGLPARLGEAWQRRVSWYPGDWVWPALAFGVVAACGAAAAIVLTRDTTPAAAPTVVLTNPVLSTAFETIPSAPEPTISATTPSATAPEPKPRHKPKPKPKPGPAVRGLVTWPAGRSGYTVVLSSIPKPQGAAAAQAEARRAVAAGLPRVGVLDSAGFSSLHPGYFVVFSGIYGTYSQANDRVGPAHAAGYGVAYPRRVTH